MHGLCVQILLVGILTGLFGQIIGCDASPQNVRAQTRVDVTAYEAELTLEPESRRLEGRVQAHVNYADTTTALHFFLTDMTVDGVRVDDQIVDHARQGEAVRIPVPRGTSTATVQIDYHGVPSQGLYARSHDDQQVIFTDSWPTRARGWLPSVDTPSDPASFRLTLHVPEGYETVANGRQVVQDTVDQQVQTTWELSASAPTYSMAFAVSDFAPTCTTSADTLSICYYMLAPDSSEANQLERTPETLSFLSDRLGPYGYDNYQVVQVPIQYGGMENAALPFLRAELFHMDGRAESVQVHEAVHQWFGNRVVIARWRDLWLSEGVATYFTTLFYEHHDGEQDARRRWVEMVDLPSERLDQTVLVPDRAVDPNEFLTWVPYRKGASVLHLFRRVMGEKAFFEAMREIYTTHAGRPLSTPIFLEALSERSAASLEDIADYWVYGADLPTLAVEWNAADRRVTWEIEDDEGTLEGVPFHIQVMDGDTPVYVPIDDQSYTLTRSNSNRAPEVRPVGILMHVSVSQK